MAVAISLNGRANNNLFTSRPRFGIRRVEWLGWVEVFPRSSKKPNGSPIMENQELENWAHCLQGRIQFIAASGTSVS